MDIYRSEEFYILLGMWLLFILGPASIFRKALWHYLKFKSSNIIPIKTKVMLLEQRKKTNKQRDEHEYDYILYVLKLNYTINNETYERIMKRSKSDELDKVVEEGEMIIYCNQKKPKQYWIASYYNDFKRPLSLIIPIIITLLFGAPLTYASYMYLIQSYV